MTPKRAGLTPTFAPGLPGSRCSLGPMGVTPPTDGWSGGRPAWASVCCLEKGESLAQEAGLASGWNVSARGQVPAGDVHKAVCLRNGLLSLCPTVSTQNQLQPHQPPTLSPGKTTQNLGLPKVAATSTGSLVRRDGCLAERTQLGRPQRGCVNRRPSLEPAPGDLALDVPPKAKFAHDHDLRRDAEPPCRRSCLAPFSEDQTTHESQHAGHTRLKLI